MTKNYNYLELSHAIREILSDLDITILQLKKDIVKNPRGSRDKIKELADLTKFMNSLKKNN